MYNEVCVVAKQKTKEKSLRGCKIKINSLKVKGRVVVLWVGVCFQLEIQASYWMVNRKLG
jgi:hypothetical protein